ncbi:hypothetical protein P261_02381 [Lachnospiraceae bacterium TWA4]|nr:hypothetical protein P261_02381 [Lachnospiraceae bacterium TWA4]
MNIQIVESGIKPEYILIQPVDEHDMEVMENEIHLIKEYSDKSFVHVAVIINDWNLDLTPWGAEPVFGKKPFGDGAADTLQSINEDIIPDLIHQYGQLPIILGGYSLAGLFSLWSGYETFKFYGIAAASPSVWYPKFNQYTSEHKIQTTYVYLSLGNKEAKTKNRVMATVADEITSLYAKCQNDIGSSNVIFEWNQGNHFIDSDIRMAKAFAWILNRENI